MKNRFMLAPLTNLQSHPDGRLSDDEFNWLTMRARGGFSLTTTCAAHRQVIGQGFPGQLGVFGDEHLGGLTRLAKTIREHDNVAIIQLLQGGMRSPAELIGQPPVCPSDHQETGARSLGLAEVEARELAQRLMHEEKIDFVDMSLWDVFKEPAEESYRGRSLLSYFTELERGDVRLGVAGKIRGASDAQACLAAGVDFVLIDRGAILHHDFPEQVRDDAGFEMVQIPVTPDYLRAEGLGDAFVRYMSSWAGFVESSPS